MILPPENLQYGLHHPDPPQSNTYHASVAPRGPSMPLRASPLSYDPLGNFYWSLFIEGNIPLPSHTSSQPNGRFLPFSLSLLTNGSI